MRHVSDGDVKLLLLVILTGVGRWFERDDDGDDDDDDISWQGSRCDATTTSLPDPNTTT